MNKKLLIIFLSLSVLIIVVILGSSFFGKYSKAKNHKELFESLDKIVQEIDIESNEIVLARETKKEADEFFASKKYLDSSIKYDESNKKLVAEIQHFAQENLDEVKKYGYDASEVESLFTEAEKKQKEILYLEAADFYKRSIKKSQQLIKQYQEEAEKLKPELSDKIDKDAVEGILNKDYKVSNLILMVDGSWAVATVVPLTFETDPAQIALQKFGENWRVIAGPGTSFEKNEYPNMPMEVLNALNGGL